MARHSDPDRSSFYSSLAGAMAKGFGALAVVVALTVVAVMLVDGRDRDDSVLELSPGGSPTSEEQSEPTEIASATPTATPTPAATPEETTPPLVEPSGSTASPSPSPSEADPTGVTVQVLDGGAGEEATQDVVATLTELGYEVVAVNAARCCYEQTTVFFSEGREDLAGALSAQDGRFGLVEPNPNLTEEVDIHVVVGTDWPTA